jgi:rhodanese-related sulfurtransferase
MLSQGFENVKTLADGYSPWVQKGYPVEGGKK